eukprot:TRINITY_DN11195_c0_g1_i1.p1 TRINITY_DN11195_c0_g1~~TRINITY_DN11195_c0_g1_i1.p1  ORF type:complete len:1318 (-),score=332.81 TRINITY_DN11195_c0_g1_i1:135-4088(-)
MSKAAHRARRAARAVSMPPWGRVLQSPFKLATAGVLVYMIYFIMNIEVIKVGAERAKDYTIAKCSDAQSVISDLASTPIYAVRYINTQIVKAINKFKTSSLEFLKWISGGVSEGVTYIIRGIVKKPLCVLKVFGPYIDNAIQLIFGNIQSFISALGSNGEICCDGVCGDAINAFLSTTAKVVEGVTSVVDGAGGVVTGIADKIPPVPPIPPIPPFGWKRSADRSSGGFGKSSNSVWDMEGRINKYMYINKSGTDPILTFENSTYKFTVRKRSIEGSYCIPIPSVITDALNSVGKLRVNINTTALGEDLVSIAESAVTPLVQWSINELEGLIESIPDFDNTTELFPLPDPFEFEWCEDIDWQKYDELVQLVLFFNYCAIAISALAFIGLVCLGAIMSYEKGVAEQKKWAPEYTKIIESPNQDQENPDEELPEDEDVDEEEDYENEELGSASTGVKDLPIKTPDNYVKLYMKFLYNKPALTITAIAFFGLFVFYLQIYLLELGREAGHKWVDDEVEPAFRGAIEGYNGALGGNLQSAINFFQDSIGGLENDVNSVLGKAPSGLNTAADFMGGISDTFLNSITNWIEPSELRDLTKNYVQCFDYFSVVESLLRLIGSVLPSKVEFPDWPTAQFLYVNSTRSREASSQVKSAMDRYIDALQQRLLNTVWIMYTFIALFGILPAVLGAIYVYYIYKTDGKTDQLNRTAKAMKAPFRYETASVMLGLIFIVTFLYEVRDLIKQMKEDAIIECYIWENRINSILPFLNSLIEDLNSTVANSVNNLINAIFSNLTLAPIIEGLASATGAFVNSMTCTLRSFVDLWNSFIDLVSGGVGSIPSSISADFGLGINFDIPIPGASAVSDFISNLKIPTKYLDIGSLLSDAVSQITGYVDWRSSGDQYYIDPDSLIPDIPIYNATFCNDIPWEDIDTTVVEQLEYFVLIVILILVSVIIVLASMNMSFAWLTVSCSRKFDLFVFRCYRNRPEFSMWMRLNMNKAALTIFALGFGTLVFVHVSVALLEVARTEGHRFTDEEVYSPTKDFIEDYNDFIDSQFDYVRKPLNEAINDTNSAINGVIKDLPKKAYEYIDKLNDYRKDIEQQIDDWTGINEFTDMFDCLYPIDVIVEALSPLINVTLSIDIPRVPRAKILQVNPRRANQTRDAIKDSIDETIDDMIYGLYGSLITVYVFIIFSLIPMFASFLYTLYLSRRGDLNLITKYVDKYRRKFDIEPEKPEENEIPMEPVRPSAPKPDRVPTTTPDRPQPVRPTMDHPERPSDASYPSRPTEDHPSRPSDAAHPARPDSSASKPSRPGGDKPTRPSVPKPSQ